MEPDNGRSICVCRQIIVEETTLVSIGVDSRMIRDVMQDLLRKGGKPEDCKDECNGDSSHNVRIY